MDKRIIAIGGGEIRSKTTLFVDGYIAKLAKQHAENNRAYGLFVGTASHDSMPYFNSFRKTYTSVFDIKADCALTVYGEMNFEKIAEKFKKADFVYIGGGDTVFMLEHWKKSGIDKLILEAYERGVIICGLSAGAIFNFETMYTDSNMVLEQGENYALHKGKGILNGVCCPHYNERQIDFDKTIIDNNISEAYAIENDCALSFLNGKLVGAVSENSNAYIIRNNNGFLEKFVIDRLNF